MSIQVINAFLPVAGGTSAISASRWRINIGQVQAGGTAWCRIKEMEYRDAVGGTDLTGSGTASASASNGGEPPANAFDNNSSTSWATGTATDPQQLEYNFGADVTPLEVAITISAVGDAPKDFTIEYHDGSTWQVAKTVVGMVWPTANMTYAFPIGSTLTAAQADLWRILNGLRQSNSAFPAWGELEFHSTVGGSDLSQSSAAIASSGTASSAFDNNTAVGWSAGSSVNGSWVGCQLASPAAIVEVVATSSATANDSIKSFNVQFFNSEYWETSWSAYKSSNWTATQTLTFASTDSYPIPVMFNANSSITSNADSTTPGTLSLPSGAAVNDIAILQVMLGDNAHSSTINTPSGWTQIDQQQITSGQNAHALFWKRLALADLSLTVQPTATGTFDAVDTLIGMISLWRFAYVGGAPFEAAGNNSGTGTAMGGAAVTTTGANRKVVHYGACIGQQLCSASAGYTEDYDVQSSSGTPEGSLKLYSIDRASAGTQSAANHTLAGSRSWHTMAMAIIPA